MQLYGLKKDDILLQISKEYDYGYNHIEAKRETRRDDIKLYVRESEADRVDVHSIYTTVQTLLAINYINEISVQFTKRKNGDEEKATNTNIIAEYDYNEMGLDIKDYIWELNRLLTGVGIQTAGDFDFTSIHPTIDNVDTLAYIFDPKGGPTIKDHRFFGIETEMTKDEMKDAGYEDYEDLGTVLDTVYLNQSNKNEAREQATVEEYQIGKKFPIIIFGSIFKGEKYIAVVDTSFKRLMKFVKLKPVFEEEKKDPKKIMFPIALKYFSFLPGDSMGISPFDLLRSKQSAYSILFNLMLKMAYKNAMGGDRLINTKKIKDLSGLAVPSLEGKDIPVNVENNEDINNIVSYVQKDTPTQLPLELKQWLTEESILDTGIDRNTQGVLAQGNNTLGEREMAQKNANLRFLLGSKQAMWGEVFRWKYLWYRQYAANLKSIDKKEFALETGYSEDFHAFTKSDFVGTDMLHLKLQSKAELEQERQAMKADRMGLYPQMIQEAMQEGLKSKIVILNRNRLRDIGEDEKRVMKLYPYTIDELNAMDKMSLIKMGMEEGVKIDSLDDEHEVFIEMFQTLQESDLKRRAIAKRYEAIKERRKLQGGLPQMQQGQLPQNGATNSAANVATAQASAQQFQQQGQQGPSLYDLTQ